MSKDIHYSESHFNSSLNQTEIAPCAADISDCWDLPIRRQNVSLDVSPTLWKTQAHHTVSVFGTEISFPKSLTSLKTAATVHTKTTNAGCSSRTSERSFKRKLMPGAFWRFASANDIINQQLFKFLFFLVRASSALPRACEVLLSVVPMANLQPLSFHLHWWPFLLFFSGVHGGKSTARELVNPYVSTARTRSKLNSSFGAPRYSV